MRKNRIENPINRIGIKNESLSLNELFPRFAAVKTAEGVSEKSV